MSIEEVLANLNPKLRKKVTLGSEVENIQFALTPSYGLNRALNGGLPYGRQVLIWGNKSRRLYRDWETDRKSTRLNSSHLKLSRMPSSA